MELNSDVSYKQLLKLIVKLNEEIDDLRKDNPKIKSDVKVLYNLVNDMPQGQKGEPGGAR